MLTLEPNKKKNKIACLLGADSNEVISEIASYLMNVSWHACSLFPSLIIAFNNIE